ncbi:myristylated tegument protein [Saimiriine alphaherpesvirus 1]|uniref:Cytoplasmic envelopment protein 3 n=1 Tax=Saimiriine herpesvirus 1 (strain MV-5-4-PSL) TaxID=10353 RepID=E2IUF9_SHV1|nr:myristylated tegument protein [Saimiriine alphaherpesvirus 1]ADO13817.1 myristylated tegument protein [Saimiriine alphaherpesvirus 1]
MGQALIRACCRRNTLVTEEGETVSLTEGEFEPVHLQEPDGDGSDTEREHAPRPQTRKPLRGHWSRSGRRARSSRLL